MNSQQFYFIQKWDISTGIPDLTGKVALITGANSSSGIGWHVAQHLALNGAKVYVGARSEDKAISAIEEMKQESGGKSLDLHPFVVELSDLKAVKAATDNFLQKETRLDILINNAGL
ncbi:hypothetical protein M422DRAFT_157943 [Sphaerobolus stellatus SS14]|nr:hypothetical protein M422DRAFT_157943 [Sphaerobolus stellatus SS14]